MDLSSILIVLAMAIIAGAVIARPFFEQEVVSPGEAGMRLSVLEAERDRILAALQETEMDYAMGKITPPDYQAQRAEWMSRGVATLKEIDELSARAPLEMEVAGRRGPKAARLDMEKELEAAVARLRREQAKQPAGFCAACGRQLFAGDRFCSVCGHAVQFEGEGR